MARFLKNIDVLAIAFVDKAANKKRFFLMKRDGKAYIMAKIDRIIKGGKGSGNFGHSGRSGEIGGSGDGGSGSLKDLQSAEQDSIKPDIKVSTKQYDKPSTKAKFNIYSATKYLEQRGMDFKPSTAETSVKHGTSYIVTDKEGNKKRMPVNDIQTFLNTNNDSFTYVMTPTYRKAPTIESKIIATNPSDDNYKFNSSYALQSRWALPKSQFLVKSSSIVDKMDAIINKFSN